MQQACIILTIKENEIFQKQPQSQILKVQYFMLYYNTELDKVLDWPLTKQQFITKMTLSSTVKNYQKKISRRFFKTKLSLTHPLKMKCIQQNRNHPLNPDCLKHNFK